jgi:chemotaxis methyl-accepting protein methylase
MIDNNVQEQNIIRGLEEVYGNNEVDERLKGLKERNPKFDDEQLLKAFEADPTCNYSFIGREANIRGLALHLSKDQSRKWQILDVGCGHGPEPYELAMRMAKEGGQFAIDAFDTSEQSIKRAKEGKFIHSSSYISSTEGDFLSEMSKAGLLNKTRETLTKIGSVDTVEYKVDDKVSSKIAFTRHDIIDKPFLPRGTQKYDIAVCNNVLLHYPTWTRELMLIHILENMKEGGLIALERNEDFDSFDMTVERAQWLGPYYKWKENLGRFGLLKEKIEPENMFIPITVYRYEPSRNSFRGMQLGIRNKTLTQIDIV